MAKLANGNEIAMAHLGTIGEEGSDSDHQDSGDSDEDEKKVIEPEIEVGKSFTSLAAVANYFGTKASKKNSGTNLERSPVAAPADVAPIVETKPTAAKANTPKVNIFDSMMKGLRK